MEELPCYTSCCADKKKKRTDIPKGEVEDEREERKGRKHPVSRCANSD